MANVRTALLAAALAALAACAAKETKPAESPAPAPVKAAAPPPAPKPAEVTAPPKAEPAKTEAPKAATPAPPPPPPAAAPAKKKTIALGLPSLAALKDDVGMDRKQLKQCKEVYDSYKPKLDEAAAKVKASQDKKATNKEVAPLRTEVLAKIREICADDAQKTKFDQATARKKKAANP